jgi:hypothetical protein
VIIVAKTVTQVILVNFLHDKLLQQVSAEPCLNKTVFHFSFKQNKKIFPPNLFLDYDEISQSRIDNYIQANKILPAPRGGNFHGICFLNFSRVFDRVSLEPIASKQIEKYYWKLFDVIWDTLSGILNAENSTEIVFDSSPHMPWDVILYFLAKDLGLKVRILRSTNIPNIMQITNNLDGSSEPERINIANRANLDFIKQYEVPFYMKKLQNRNENSSFLSQRSVKLWWTRYFLHRAKSIVSQRFDNHALSYFDMSLIKVFEIEFKFAYLIAKNRRFLINLADPNPDLDRPFIYFALHAQPERTTDPDAGYFTDQIYAIKFVADRLPNGWLMYVKEHPMQYDIKYMHPKQHSSRSKDFYKEIALIPNVKLIAPSVSSSDLISKCKVTCTCTGSTTWEGFGFQKPGIVLGNSWLRKHGACLAEETITIENLEEIAKISNELFKNAHDTFIEKYTESFTIGCSGESYYDQELELDKVLVSMRLAINL